MKLIVPLRLSFAMALLVALAVPGASQDRSRTSRTSRTDLPDEYRLIFERNIFNSTRRAAPRSEAPAPTPVPTPAAETLDLLGIWIADGQTLAFVEGSRAEFSTILAVGDRIDGMILVRSEFSDTPAVGNRIDGMILVRIEIDQVVLEQNDTILEWPLGHRLERRGDGEWVPSGASVLSAAARPIRSSSSPSSSSSEPELDEDEAEDLIRQLRERRQREMNP